jgi:site-specific DNA-methyltransferase (adenine-specific)
MNGNEGPAVPPALFYQDRGQTIIHGNVLTTRHIPAGTVDLVVTSPPYNVDIKYTSHDDRLSYDDYLAFSRKWMVRCYRWLAKSGRFCLNIPLDKNKGGQQSVGADLTTLAKDAGFRYHATIIWNEGNISRRTAWGSWMNPSAPFVIAPVELIVVLYKGTWKKPASDKKSDITRDEFMAWTNGLWTFPGESRKKAGHPAPFPVELPRRCMKLFSYIGDTVLDPFMGSGSTLVAAYGCDRKGIGIELDEGYCRVARERIRKEKGPVL